MSLIVAVMLVSGVLGVAALYFGQRRRELEHRERMAALEKGQPLPPTIPPELLTHTQLTPRDYLRRGLLWLFFGIGVFLAFYLAGWAMPGQAGDSVARFAFAGLVPAAVGLAYLVFYATDPERQ